MEARPTQAQPAPANSRPTRRWLAAPAGSTCRRNLSDLGRNDVLPFEFPLLGRPVEAVAGRADVARATRPSPFGKRGNRVADHLPVDFRHDARGSRHLHLQTHTLRRRRATIRVPEGHRPEPHPSIPITLPVREAVAPQRPVLPPGRRYDLQPTKARLYAQDAPV